MYYLRGFAGSAGENFPFYHLFARRWKLIERKGRCILVICFFYLEQI
jgi:hypothetical protein